MSAIEPSNLALFWAAVIALAILVYVILDGFDLGVGILFGTTGDAARRDDGGDLAVLGWQRDLAGGDRLLALRRLPGGLCGIPAGFLHSRAAALVRADLSRRRFRVSRRRRRAPLVGLGLFCRLDRCRIRPRRGGWSDDPRHSRGQ